MKPTTALFLAGIVRLALLVALCMCLGKAAGQPRALEGGSPLGNPLELTSASDLQARVRPLYDWEELPMTTESPGGDADQARATDPLYDWEELPGRSHATDP